MRQQPSEIAGEVARRLELAMLLEVSAYPKPGNVHRTRDHSGTTFQHFLASAVAARPLLEVAARRGVLISKRKITPREAGVGRIIRDAVANMMSAHHGGNTSLGTVMLLVPLAVAAGITFTRRRFSLTQLRRETRRVLASTRPADAIALYETLALAKPGGLGTAPDLDVNDPSSRSKIRRLRLNLLDVARLAAEWDSICSEWVTGYRITFELGYPYFRKELARTGDLNKATVNTYLRILSEIPDTLIARKAGVWKAKWISKRARSVLASGGLSTKAGRVQIKRLDRQLAGNRNLLNPGATADISASVLALATLSGYRP